MNKKEFLDEFIGTFLMVLFGCGAVAVTTLFGAHQGLFQIGIIWGIAITLAIYITRDLSCAHFNPAVTIAMVASGRMTIRKAPCYLAAQFCGSFMAAMTLYGLFGSSIAAYEQAHGIVRGTFESVETAKLFGEYYLQPGGPEISMMLAAAAELFGTFLLVLTIFCLTENCNVGKPSFNEAPIFIGLTVTSLIFLLAPLTVLADPERLRRILDGADTADSYIGAKQFEEADVILINKIDLLDDTQRESLRQRAAEKWPNALVLTASVKAGSGVAEWLELVMQPQAAGTHLAQVDYDRYADGEAAYGWLNASYALDGEGDCARAARSLLDGLCAAFTQQNAPVGHVKFLLQAGETQWIGNLTGGPETASLREEPRHAEKPMLTVNARVEMEPEKLLSTVQQAVAEALNGISFQQIECRCLTPGRPNPTYRYDRIIGGEQESI